MLRPDITFKDPSIAEGSVKMIQPGTKKTTIRVTGLTPGKTTYELRVFNYPVVWVGAAGIEVGECLDAGPEAGVDAGVDSGHDATPDAPLAELPPPDAPAADLNKKDAIYPDLGLNCCVGAPSVVLYARSNAVCSNLSPAKSLGTLAPGTYRFYYKGGAARTGKSFDWNRLYASCDPKCSVSTSGKCWLAEWTLGELPGFTKRGFSSKAAATTAVKCSYKEFVVTRTISAKAWYLDNDNSDNEGSVSCCWRKNK